MAIIGIGIGVAVAIGFCRPIQPTATAIATAIPTPTDIVFSFLFDTAKCQPTYDLVGIWRGWNAGGFACHANNDTVRLPLPAQLS
jgi:hypothetical protein